MTGEDKERQRTVRCAPGSLRSSHCVARTLTPPIMFTPEQDHGHLQLALAQARKSMAEGGIPIGCAGLPARR
jgi:hypothetical protein